MIESIIYIISTLMLFVTYMCIEKSKEKIELIKSTIIAMVLLIAYNGFVCYILNLINIPITLVSLSVVNFIISILMLVLILKNKKLQKYKICKTNIIVTLIFIIIVGIITNINFGGLSKIRYVSMDAREHYKAAREFSENTRLSNKSEENNTTGECFMPVAYINEGILFKIFNSYIGTVNLYKVYILFEAFALGVVGIMFYFIVDKYAKSIKIKIIAIIFSVIYVLGYPLNAWISGFHYLILGILFVEAIIYMQCNNDEYLMENNILTLFLMNFGLILSYSLFCPFVYGSEFLYYIYKYRKNMSEIVLYTVVTLIVPGIIGVVYLILPCFGQVEGFIALEGWLYKNLWSNFILFIPFSMYSIYKSIRNKKYTFDNIILVTLVLYMIILFVGTKIGRCSEYYFYKNYFILWMVLILLNIRGMISAFQIKDVKYIIYTVTILYLIIFGISVYLEKTYITQNANDSLSKTMEIFTFNNTMITVKNAEFITKGELELYYEMEKILNDNWKEYDDEILFVTNPTQERWIQSLVGYKNILFDDKDFAIQNLEEENYKYIVIFENRETYEKMKQYIKTQNMELLYENSTGKIYKKSY